MQNAEHAQFKIGELHEIFQTYEEIYSQLSALKHIIFRATHLADLENLAVLFSTQIKEKIVNTSNAVWLTLDDCKITEIARNGALVPVGTRPTVNIESSPGIKKMIFEQLVLWPPHPEDIQQLFQGFVSPNLFPLKNPKRAFGFFVIDQVDEKKREIFQWFSQFAAMIFNISNLHQKVKDKNDELEEMTDILFTQQSRMAAVQRMGMEMMKISKPEVLYGKLLDTTITEFTAKSSILLIIHGNQLYLTPLLSRGFPEIKCDINFPIGEHKIFKRCIESGRIINQKDFPRELTFGPYSISHWLIFPIKGRERTYGILVVDIADPDGCDAITIMLNQCGMLLDNFTV